MAANMGMAGNGHLLLQQQQNNNNQRQLQQIVYGQLVQNTPAIPGGGWQAGMQINDRLGKTLNLISNVMLAMPQTEWRKAANYSLELEKKCFFASPDRITYEQTMAGKTAEMVRKRQAQAPALQNQLSAEAAARQQQAQVQAQQQQMMMNQNAAIQAQMAARGMVPPGQQGFQHLRGPMQASPIPQPPQQMAMGAAGLQQSQPNQPPFMMNMQQQRQVGGTLQDRLASLHPQRRMEILESANQMLASQSEEQRQNLRNAVQAKMSQQQLAECQSKNQDPLVMYYQQQALYKATRHAQNMYLRQQQGMGPNASPAQAAMLQQQQQHQHQQLQLQQQQQQQQQKPHMAMNPGMLNNNLGVQAGLPGAQLFAGNMENIINEQKAGFLAEQSGQIVVPASNGANRNATPQPIGGMGAQNMSNGQSGPAQPPRPPQMGQPFNLSQVKMNQQAAQTAAQNKAQAAAQQMQGQPGGLAGVASTSQSPAMNTLTAPLSQPPVPMGGVGQVNAGRFNPGNQTMGQVLDQRFNQQANTRPISMSGNINVNSAALNQMLSAMPVDKRQNVSAMPPDKLASLMASWQEQQQRNAMPNGLMPQQPVPGQQHLGQMGNQFLGNPQQPPNPNMTPSVQQAIMQSQLAARAQTQVTAQAVAANPQAQVMMDSMDVNQVVLDRLRPPPEVKKWGQLKAWMQNNPTPYPPQFQQQLVNIQLNQFRELMQRRQAAGGPNGTLGAAPQQQLGTPAQQLQQNSSNFPQGFRFPPQVMQVTPADIEALRSDPRFAGQDHQSLAKFALKMKQERFIRGLQLERMRKQQQETQQQQLGLGNPVGPVHQQQGGSVQQEATTQPNMMNTLNIPASQQPAQKPVSTGPEPTTAGAKNNSSNANKASHNRVAPPNPSPATAAKNLKRSSPDDEAPTAVNATNQRPTSQPAARPMGGQPTPEMIASWTPEQRQRWEQHQRRQGLVQPDPEELKRWSELFRTIGSDEAAKNRVMQDVQMSAEERQDLANKLPKLASDMNKFGGKGLQRWYWITRDDHKTRLFFRMRARLSHQFVDGDRMTQLKDSFSIRAAEANHYRMLLNTMGQEVATHAAIPRKAMAGNVGGHLEATASAAAAAAAAAQNQPAVQAPQQAPLNPANLEKHTQALNKMHQRSNSKSGQAPAAPTTTQPPFQFGAQKSPTGQPTYFNKPAVTQDTLIPPPPARKKAKTGLQQVPSPAIPQTGPSPQAKVASPEVKRLPQAEQSKAPPRPLLVCPDAKCDMHSTGFATKEALDAHYHEQHVRPFEDPIKFMEETLTKALGLDAEGHRTHTGGPTEISQAGAPAMKPSGSKQGQTLVKSELVSTPMSRDASMRRQGSAPGGKGAEHKGTLANGKGAPAKPENTPKPTMKSEPEQPQGPPTEDPWANSTVDPQALLATFAPLVPMINGQFSNFSPHRSRTPNDTPESSKDSGASEPNSDISERALIDIDMKWAPLDLDSDLLVGLDAFSMETNGSLLADSGSEFPSWDELQSEFSKYDHDKPFELDSSLYFMHCS